jgi:hypothetical protein
MGRKPAALFAQGAELTLHLESMPRVFRLTEESAKADGHGRCDGWLHGHNASRHGHCQFRRPQASGWMPAPLLSKFDSDLDEL